VFPAGGALQTPPEHTRLVSVHAPPVQHGSPLAPHGPAPLEDPLPDPELDPAPELEPELEPELDPELPEPPELEMGFDDVPEHAGASVARKRASAAKGPAKIDGFMASEAGPPSC
jgi:hypothetical protein